MIEESAPVARRLSPVRIFVGMFITPRQTVRAMLDRGPSVGATIGLAILGGAVSGFDNGLDNHIEDATPLATALFAGTLVGSIGGLLGFFLLGWMFFAIGRMLKGTGSQWDVYQGLAWTRIPAIVGIVPLIAMAALAGNGQVGTTSYMVALLVYMFVLLWSIVTGVRGMAEAHQFSSWRSLAAWLICGLIIVLVVFLVVMILSAIMLSG